MVSESKKDLAKLALKMCVAGWLYNKKAEDRLRKALLQRIGNYMGVTIQMDGLKIGLTGRIKARGLLVNHKQVQVSVSAMAVRLSIAALLKRTIKINSVIVDNVTCLPGTATHYSTMYATSDGTFTIQGVKKYYQLAFRLLGAFFKDQPQKLFVKQANVSLHFRNRDWAFSLQELDLRDGQYKMKVDIPLFLRNVCILEGKVDVDRRSLTLEGFTDIQGNKKCEIQFRGEQSHFSYEKLFFEMALTERAGIHIAAGGTGFEIVNRLVSSGKMLLPEWKLVLNGRLENDSFCIEKGSGIICSLFRCEIFLCHLFQDESLDIRTQFSNISLENFLKICPDNVCEELQTVDYSGSLSLDAGAVYFIRTPEKSSFHAKLDQDKFVLNREVQSAFCQLSFPFMHQVRENDQVIKGIELSDQNPFFMPFGFIPERLIATIICTEDPNFFSHKGIDQLFIGYAMLQNLQEGRIVRGGSTITMQVVRNLYLGHKRNIYRKLEELLIAWLLEEGLEISKKRILEIYLNIIEFGPGIYGIKEACSYYFSKLPAELSVTECIVLSYIIPRPKHFEDALRSNSKQLRTNLKKHIEFVSRSLLLNAIIGPDEYENIRLDIPIRNTVLSL